MTTVFETFIRAADTYPNNGWLSVTPETAIAYDIQLVDINYAEAKETVLRLRTLYAEAGYGPGQRIGRLLENRPAFLLHWFALNALGVPIVPLNPDLHIVELSYVINHSEIIAVVAIPSRHAALKEAAARPIPCVPAAPTASTRPPRS